MNKSIQPVGMAHLLLSILVLAFAPARAALACPFPVQPADLVSARFAHYYGPDDKAVFQPGFSWSFVASRLTITAGTKSISPDLLQQLAAGFAQVRKIEARWKLGADHLIISEIKVNGMLTKATARLPVSSTAPGLFRIGAQQYVFTSKN